MVGVPEVKGQKINFALIGTCTNGRLDDIRQAAAILKGRHIAKGVRMIVTPASRQVYLAAAREGLIEALTEAGASVEAAGCGTCVNITGHLITGDGEVVISSANRNFKGRLGNRQVRDLDRLGGDGRGLRAHRTHHRPAYRRGRRLAAGIGNGVI